MNILDDWINTNKKPLEVDGFEISTSDSVNSCFLVDLDGENLLGRICYWEPSTFEIQFNSCITGDVIILESKECNGIQEFEEFFKILFSKLEGLASP